MALLLLVVGGCTSPASPPEPLHELTGPGLVLVPGIAALHSSGSGGFIRAVSAYAPARAASGARALVEFSSDVHDVGLDGSALAPVQLPPGCQFAAPAPAGDWVACAQAGTLALRSLGGGDPVVTHIFPTEQRVSLGFLAWAPDGRHLAAVTHLGGGCAIELLAVAPTRDAAPLVALLTFVDHATPMPGYGEKCPLQYLAWSPDGNWLAVWESLGVRTGQILALPLHAALPDGLPSDPAARRTVAVGQDVLVRLASTGDVEALAWRTEPTPSGVMGVTFAEYKNHEARIVHVDLASRRQTTILATREESFDALSWTPDGERLVFAYGRQTLICPCVPSRLYVYTPPPSSSSTAMPKATAQ